MPTETVYGLAANAYSADAVGDIFKAKGRPSDNPLIVHIASLEQLRDLVDPSAFPAVGSPVHQLCEKFWPGPLTILFRKSERVPTIVTAGLDTVAVRMPAHPVARRIIELSGLPLAAPSANRSGRPSPTTAEHVMYDLGCTNGVLNHVLQSRVLGEGSDSNSGPKDSYSGLPCIVDGGNCIYGVESTVIDPFASEGPIVLRPGGVTVEQLREVLPGVRVFKHAPRETATAEQARLLAKPATPGLKYTHYAPNANVRLAEVPSRGETLETLETAISAHLDAALENGGKVGVIHTQPTWTYLGRFQGRDGVIVMDIGTANDPSTIARNLFAALRSFDEQGVTEIVVEGVSEAHEGLAVMNRIRKAATSTFLRRSKDSNS
mmetsp:Transcript_20158/g.77172  ORF Transcript_20158/g.77172 Transcript_20158/m.77172 type:complete len:377 (-) Transcript_20158:40-1170(-)